MRDIEKELTPKQFILLLEQARNEFRFASHKGLSVSETLLAIISDLLLADMSLRAGKKPEMSMLDAMTGKETKTKSEKKYRTLTLEEAAAL